MNCYGRLEHSSATFTLHVCMHTRLENGVLHNEQQSGSAVNSFFDQGKFDEVMKMVSDWEAACYDEHQFHSKIKVST